MNSPARHAYLDGYLNQCNDLCKQLNREKTLGSHKLPTLTQQKSQNYQRNNTAGAPKVLRRSPDFFDTLLDTTQKIASAVTRDEQVKSFINSEPFQSLVRYRQQRLVGDFRDHSYLCGLVNLKVAKSDVLKAFLDKLEYATTMREVNAIFNDFYQGKNEFRDAYKTLNMGQNITTRLFSSFGVKTTTVTLIDELAKLKDELLQQRRVSFSF